MISFARRVVRFLESARLATWLLVFVGAWSIVATFVPQGDPSVASVADWAATHPLMDRIVQFIGLHHAFSAPVFRISVAVLAVSTALCAWRRTRVALRRMAALREAAVRDAGSLLERHDIEVACCAGADASGALSTAAETLDRLDIRTERRGDVLSNVSPTWSVWGSPLFHWGLLAIMVVVLVGSLQRSEGLMGIPVGQVKPDAPDSYGVLHAGPLHTWSRIRRSIRVDSFDTAFYTGKIDRGPTPTVSVLDQDGKVVKTQHIYPNSPLQTGSLTIHPADFGLAVDLSLLSTAGKVYGRTTQLVDIAADAPDRTVPVGAVTIGDKKGQSEVQVAVTVPLGHDGTDVVVPDERSAHLVITRGDSTQVSEAVLKPGESITLSTGDLLRVDNVGFYARLSVVDDATIPFLYAAMALAVFGLVLTLVFRQQAVLVTAVEGVEGTRVFVAARLWRNVPTTRNEIEVELSHALGGDEEGLS